MTLLLVIKLVVICSGKMDPNLDLAFCIEIEEEVSLLKGEAWLVSGSMVSLMLLTSEWVLEALSKVADKVRSGWRLLRPEPISFLIIVTIKRISVVTSSQSWSLSITKSPWLVGVYLKTVGFVFFYVLVVGL